MTETIRKASVTYRHAVTYTGFLLFFHYFLMGGGQSLTFHRLIFVCEPILVCRGGGAKLNFIPRDHSSKVNLPVQTDEKAIDFSLCFTA